MKWNHDLLYEVVAAGVVNDVSLSYSYVLLMEMQWPCGYKQMKKYHIEDLRWIIA